MQHSPTGNIVFSPSDLTVFMESAFASMMDRHRLEDRERFEPDAPSEMDEVLARRGDEHERAILVEMGLSGQSVVEIDRGAEDPVRLTLAALDSDCDVIFQAALVKGDFAGFADFLVRNTNTDAWEVWDTKLARSVKPRFIVQLCCYAEMLEAMTGGMPDTIGVILGNGLRVPFRSSDYLAYYRRVEQAFREHIASFAPGEMPEPTGFGSNGRWQSHAERRLRAADHLALVAGIRESQVKRLHEVGIRTMTVLAETLRDTVPGIGVDVFPRLREQARMQMRAVDGEPPPYEYIDRRAARGVYGLELLPPAGLNDVFFDIEGYPLGTETLEYLFGAAFRDGDTVEYRDWWACDRSQERAAFEGFVDWAYARWQADPSMHIYHYAHYEVTALTRLMGAYSSRENKIDNLLRAGVFVDLYRVVRQGLIIGAVGYSIKDVERLYRRGREGAVGTAQDSVVEFDRWTESGEPADWNQSGILRGVRDYNRDDCISTLELADWLRSRQAAKGIAWVGLQHREEVDSDAGPRSDSEQLSVDMLNALPTEESAFDDDDRITQTLGWLLEYHRREAKPAWWAFFSRATQTTDELFEDADCLAGLVRTTKPPSPDKRSHEYEYAFDPDQETRMQEGNRCRFAHDVGLGAKIAALDRDRGITVLRIGNTNPPPPDTLDLVPGGPVDAGVLRDSIFRTTRRWWSERKLQPAMRDFLLRLPPRIHGRDRGEPVIGPDTDLVEGSIEAIANLTDSLLCIQGPPGCGKTFTAARCIIDLLQRGRRVGVTSNGHKAILNLLRQVASEATKLEFVLRGLKIGEADDLATDPHFLSVESASNWTPATGDDRPLVGGTAWAFAREDWARGFDYLFIDEAGQVPMANLIAVAPAARNLVVIGDQMQLDQPRQGTHPGHSGMSVMDYLLHGHPTIPPDRGVFLDRTWRLHPEICDFISKFVYEGRLRTAPHCRNRVISVPPDGGGPVDRSAGIQFHPCSHEGNSQESPEEVDAIERVVASLVGRGKTDESGNPSGTVSFDDILFVAPYNMQVNRLRRRLGPMARVASVDKFQGQEAPVVVLSMSASSTADLPRGMEFLLSQNRLNVALTRAQSVAIVVGSPALTYPKCATLDQMRVANFFCSLVDYASRADTASRP